LALRVLAARVVDGAPFARRLLRPPRDDAAMIS
jgi:hypothetical protein